MKKIIIKCMASIWTMAVILCAVASVSSAKEKTEIIKKDKLIEYSGNAATYKVPDNVTYIDSKAFKKAKKLNILVVGRNVKWIAYDALSTAVNLKKITVSKKNRYYSSYKGALYNKKGTRFEACPGGMKKLKISDKCRTMSETNTLGNNIEELIIGKNVKLIEGGAFFYKMPNLKKISVVKGNKNYYAKDNALFEKTYNGSENGITLVKYAASSGVKEYTIPEGTTYLAPCAFSYTKLDSITVSESVKKYDELVFYKSKVSNITFNGTCEFPGIKDSTLNDSSLFSDCPNLKTLTFTDMNVLLPPMVNNWIDKSVTICSPANSTAHKYAIEYGINWQELK